jgi:8-oxo-dGTP pyrophosphatase MutT (NUDIX family)
MEEKDTNKIAKMLILDRGRVLLLMSKHLNKFHLPGGHLVGSETFVQGLKREVKEETGLNVAWCKVIFCKPNFCLYKGGVYPATIKLSDEHNSYVWAKIEDAHKYPLCNYTKRDIFGLQKFWKNKKLREQQNKEYSEEIEQNYLENRSKIG